MIDYDSELRRHHHALLGALDVRNHARVLDVGCGAGQTTRDVARIATEGSAVGIDTAESVLQSARQLSIAVGLRNVEYVCGDAACLPLSRASVDLVISRFGTMFFSDPVVAFTNIRTTLRPGGRLVMMVWQAAPHNAWTVAIHRALVGDNTALPEPQLGPSAFSLGEELTVRRILDASSFVDIGLEAVHEPVYYGADVESALGFVMLFANVKNALELQSANERERTVSRLREAMADHQTSEGILFDSRAWIVTARCSDDIGNGIKANA